MRSLLLLNICSDEIFIGIHCAENACTYEILQNKLEIKQRQRQGPEDSHIRRKKTSVEWEMRKAILSVLKKGERERGDRETQVGLRVRLRRMEGGKGEIVTMLVKNIHTIYEACELQSVICVIR